MAQNKILNVEPGYITSSSIAVNILNCGITSLAGPVGYTQTQPYIIVKHVRVINVTNVQQSVFLYKGATGASAFGSMVILNNTPIPANSYLDWYGQARFDSADFLTGSCTSSSSLVYNIDGEIGLS